MTMIKVKNEECDEKPFESRNSQEQHVSRGRRRRPLNLSVKIARKNYTGSAGQDVVVVKVHHEKKLIEAIIHDDLQGLGAEIHRAIVPIIRKNFGYQSYRAESGGSSESLQPIGGHLNRSYGENHSVNSPLQRKRKTSDSFSMLCKGHKLTNLKEVGQCFSYADIEDDKAVASSEDDAPLPSSEEYSPVKIGNKNAVKKFYEDIFSRIGQANLKSILKTWIKVIEPRKQSTYPYNGGSKAEASKMMFGEDNPERLVLAVHLLCNEGWAVEMLRTSTHETLSLDQETTTLLDEIYDMREKQEQFLDGAIDDDVTIPVRLSKTTTTKRKKKSMSTRQYSEPQAIATEQRSLPELVLPTTQDIIGNELPVLRNNAVLNSFPGSDYPSAYALAEFYQQGPLQEVHAGGMASSPYSGSNGQIQFPMPITPTQQVPLQALSTAAMVPAENMTQCRMIENPIAQAYNFVRSQSVLHERSPSYKDWGTSGHKQHDFNDDAVANRYSPGYTSIGYPISNLASPLLPLNLPENYGRPLPQQVQLAQMQSNGNVLDDDGAVSHAQHRR